jgi:hypothetical protein
MVSNSYVQINSLASGALLQQSHGQDYKCEFQFTKANTVQVSNAKSSSFEPTKPGITKEPPTWSQEIIQETVDLWDVTETERAKLVTLGQRLRDVHHDKNVPRQAIRFLRKERGNVDAAESSFRKMIAWRLENKVDTILEWYQPPKQLLEYYPASVLQGRDKFDEPVYLERTGAIDHAGMLKRFGKEECILHAIWMREMVVLWVANYEKTNQRNLRQLTIISDAYGLPIWQCMTNRNVLAVFKETMRLDTDYYPEGKGKTFIIRVPMLFETQWKILRHFFHSGELQKMIICGNADYKKILSQHMDLSILPDCVVPEVGLGKAEKSLPADFRGGTLSQ